MRGTAILLLSYATPLAGAYVIFMVLARVFTKEEFAAFSVVNASVAMLNAVIAGGTIQAVARNVAQASGDATRVRTHALKRQVLFSTVLTGALVLLATPYARMLDDERLSALLMVAAFIPGLYALTAVQQGALNGAGRFGAQGAINTIVSILRPVLVVGAVFWGLGLSGVFIAVAIASTLTFGSSFYFFRSKKTAADVTTRAEPNDDDKTRAVDDDASPDGAAARPRSALWFSLGQFGIQMLLSSDLLLLKALSPGDDGDALIALYVAAQTVARIPYGLLLGVPQIAFAGAAKRDDARRRERAGLTMALVMSALVLMWALVLPLAEPILLVVYPESFRDAAAYLALFVVGSGLLALGDVSQVTVAGAHGPRGSLVVIGLAVVAQVSVASVLIPTDGAMGALTASLTGASVFAVLGLALLVWRIRPLIPWRVVATAMVLSGGAGMAAYLVSQRGPSPFMALVAIAALGTIVSGIFVYATVDEIKTARNAAVPTRRPRASA